MRFNKNKKAIEMVWSVVIIGALSLFLVIAFAPMMGTSFASMFKATNPNCEGQCKASCDAYSEYENYNADCGKDEHCCLSYDATETDSGDEDETTGTTPSGTGLCKDKKEGTRCDANKVCDANLICIDKCVYCSNKPSSSICKTFSLGDTPFTFNSDFKCECTYDQYVLLSKGGVFNLKGDKYYSAKEFCGGDYYCCNNKDTKGPIIEITTTSINTDFKDKHILNIHCMDTVQNNLGTACDKLKYKISMPSTGTNYFTELPMNQNQASLEVNNDILINSGAIKLGAGYKGQVIVSFIAYDKVGNGGQQFSPSVNIVTVGKSTFCSYGENVCLEQTDCYDDRSVFREDVECIKCSRTGETECFNKIKQPEQIYTCSEYKDINGGCTI